MLSLVLVSCFVSGFSSFLGHFPGTGNAVRGPRCGPGLEAWLGAGRSLCLFVHGLEVWISLSLGLGLANFVFLRGVNLWCSYYAAIVMLTRLEVLETWR